MLQKIINIPPLRGLNRYSENSSKTDSSKKEKRFTLFRKIVSFFWKIGWIRSVEKTRRKVIESRERPVSFVTIPVVLSRIPMLPSSLSLKREGGGIGHLKLPHECHKIFLLLPAQFELKNDIEKLYRIFQRQ